MIGLLEDIRYALRGLRAQPGYLVLAVATLALSIGANATMFSVVRGVLLRPLAFAEPDRLMTVHETLRQWMKVASSPANLQAWDERTDVFESLAGVTSVSMNLATAERPERVDGALVTANYLATLGVEPLLGRVFLPADDEMGADAIVVLGHDVWQIHFAGGPPPGVK